VNVYFLSSQADASIEGLSILDIAMNSFISPRS